MPPPADPLLRDLWLLWRASGLSAAEVSRRAGIGLDRFSRWMSGQEEPRLSSLRPVLAIFGYDIRIQRIARSPVDEGPRAGSLS